MAAKHLNKQVCEGREIMGTCPLCGKLNDDDWPLEIGGKIVEGGCQDCWEQQCDEAWWEYGQMLETKEV